LEAHGSARESRVVQRAEPRNELRATRSQQHADPGARHHERPAVREIRVRARPELPPHFRGRRSARWTDLRRDRRFSYNIVKDPLHIADFHATVLHLLGYNHERFTFKFQGLDQRLTGVLPAKVVPDLIA
jgi:hypothetical protein